MVPERTPNVTPLANSSPEELPAHVNVPPEESVGEFTEPRIAPTKIPEVAPTSTLLPLDRLVFIFPISFRYNSFNFFHFFLDIKLKVRLYNK